MAGSPGLPPHGSAGTAVLVGLMSGTSADGISAAVVRFHPGSASGVRADLLGFLSRPFGRVQRERLLRATEGGTPPEYCRLNVELGGWLADAAIAVIAEAGVARQEVSAIASHGHTVWHEPGHSTWQFGEAAVIAERTGIDVISDFRVRDVAAGGQGAPLVSMADALLFSSPDGWRALQNLGGIGNITVVPPNGVLESVRAFDTGPGCGVIDGVTRALFPELSYDVDGTLARRGHAIDRVLDELLAERYFAAPPPKSTGRELFSADYVRRLIDGCRRAAPGSTPEDLIATAVTLTARSIALAFQRFIPEPVGELLLSGGGAKNPALCDAIASALGAAPGAIAVRRFEEVYFDPEAKEAVAFALLGWLHLRGRAGNVPAATGARGARVLGKLTPA